MCIYTLFVMRLWPLGRVEGRRLAAAIKRAKQATALTKLARKRGRHVKRVQFAQGVQAARAISKTAQKEKRSSKKARKGDAGQARGKKVGRAYFPVLGVGGVARLPRTRLP